MGDLPSQSLAQPPEIIGTGINKGRLLFLKTNKGEKCPYGKKLENPKHGPMNCCPTNIGSNTIFKSITENGFFTSHHHDFNSSIMIFVPVSGGPRGWRKCFRLTIDQTGIFWVQDGTTVPTNSKQPLIVRI